jgi:hypothetical protein
LTGWTGFFPESKTARQFIPDAILFILLILSNDSVVISSKRRVAVLLLLYKGMRSLDRIDRMDRILPGEQNSPAIHSRRNPVHPVNPVK